MKLTAVFFLLIVSLDVAALTIGEAINIAGRQRMLSQRITQAFILNGVQPEAQRHQKVLKRSVQEFERNNQKLNTFPAAEKIKDQLKKVQSEWQPFKQLSLQPVTREGATDLFLRSNKLLTETHSYVVKLQQLANHNSAELINIAGRQRMLSQRICKNYAAKLWNISPAEAEQGLQQDLTEYSSRLTRLLESTLNTPEISSNLLKAKDHLSYASRGFEGEMKLSEQRQIQVITGTTDLMLRDMDVVTKQYASLLDSRE
ncbi:type IV pili methyl-accepting chemotaxis transducer N-terminal domain-containing protein [Microbulbifer sp. ANSA002]|uniref:type IV pili methyl-accepting chemotaxis transducer N-terminal domain-containing protein n=1 Tax=unclassified Microbulbifer TaxID=2619833 RepID=UPI004042E635